MDTAPTKLFIVWIMFSCFVTHSVVFTEIKIKSWRYKGNGKACLWGRREDGEDGEGSVDIMRRGEEQRWCLRCEGGGGSGRSVEGSSSSIFRSNVRTIHTSIG